MKNFTRTFKVFYIFLVLCFILVSISSGQSGKNRGYWMDVVILPPSDLLCPVPEEVLKVDTTGGCKGAFIPYAFKSLYINTLEHCFDLPDPLFSGSGITVLNVEVGCKRDHHTGYILNVQFWLEDTEHNYYRTEILELASPVLPNPYLFEIVVNHCFEVKSQTGRGKKNTLGYLKVGTIKFLKKNGQ